MGTMREKPRLALVVPCYNEEVVLPETVPLFVGKLSKLAERGVITEDSFVLFCNDGSKDSTWDVIRRMSGESARVHGLSLSRNRGHQNVLLAGLMEVRDRVDIAVSIDCDGQDDINAIDEMVEQYANGAEVVYGVRRRRVTDTWFKRTTAELFYHLMKGLGADIVFNHADYRLASARVLREFADFREVNLFLRGLFPLVGFKSAVVYYDRHERLAGGSHYPFLKMLGFAWDGITSLSVRPIRAISVLGALMSVLSLFMIIWCLCSYFAGRVVPGWASSVIVSCLIGGVQLLSLGVIGEYVGKVYLETKGRPRFVVEERV